MITSRRYFSLILYPLVFFLILGSVQYAIVERAYQSQKARSNEPYVDGAPIRAINLKPDRRPQSIYLP